jgi:hypothetical protein
MSKKINPYIQVFEELESELLTLSYYIYVDDSQLSVYSTKITELIMRAAIEIESISKELYREDIENKENMSYTTALPEIIKKWSIGDSKIELFHSNFHLANSGFKPFTNWKSTWHIPYVNLKHDRNKYHSKDGVLNNLLNMMAALYLLNCLYKSPKDARNKNVIFESRVFAKVTVGKGGREEIWQPVMSGVSTGLNDDTPRIVFNQ